jgi:hemoglobin/transferrin/lactoferrin receptor protein
VLLTDFFLITFLGLFRIATPLLFNYDNLTKIGVRSIHDTEAGVRLNVLRMVHRSCAALLLGGACLSSAFSQLSPFAGRVVDASSHRGVDRASVNVIETGIQASTDSSGRFRLSELSPGQYTVSVRRIGYAEAERTIVVPALGREQETTGVERTFVVPLLNRDQESASGATAPTDGIVIELQSVLLQADDVIIRSTRTSSVARNAPFPLEVVMHDDPLLHSAITVSDAIGKTSGASLVRDGAWETAISIRGMSRSNIVMLVDDTRIETANDIAGALSLVDVHELERVEVLKSPGSSLYGSGALGGVIHLMMKRPSFSSRMHTHLEVNEGVTSVDRGASHHLAFENSSDAYALRMSGGYRKAGNTMTPAGSLPNSQYADFNIAGQFGLKTHGLQTLFITYQRTQAEDTGIPGGAPIATAAQAKYLLARRELFAVDYSIPNISMFVPLLTVKLSRQTIDRNVEIVQTPALTLTPHAVHGTASAQIESKLAVGPDMLLTVGTEAWQRDLDSRREKIMKSADLIIGERPVPVSSFFSGGLYVHNEWRISPDRMTLALGGRYDWIRVSNDDAYNPDYRITSGIEDRQPRDRHLLWKHGTAHDESWSANAGAVYTLSSAVNLSCLAAAAFRSPSLEERFQFIDLGSLVRVGDPTLRPERSISINAGVHLRHDLISVQADFFYNGLTDLVTEIPGTFEGRPALVKANIGEARLYGFEFTGATLLTSWAALSYSIAYVRGEDMRTHANLPQIAPLNGQAALKVSLPSIGSMEVSSSYAFTQDLTAAGEMRTPGYAAADADFFSEPCQLKQTSFTFNAGIRNIFNKAYRTHLSTLRGLIQQEPGTNLYLSVTVGI